MGASIPQVKGMQAVEFKEGESDVFEFDVQADDDNVETYSETEVEELKNTISDLQTKIAQFKEDAKKQDTIKSLKSQVKDLTVELAKFKDEAAGKEELAKELKDDSKYADADEESVEIFNQAKTIAQEENISFKDALLKVNTKEI